MVDIHCHILPGIDDGAADIDTSLGMAKIAAKDGITRIVATPHFRYEDKPTTEDISENADSLREQLKNNNIPLVLMNGADIRLTYELMYAIEKNAIPTINGSRYFLLELPDLIPPHIDEFIFEVKLKGFVPIITHPERNYSLLAAPEKIGNLRKSGAPLQLTAMSITGEFGMPVRRLAHMLLKKGLVDFVATDAHGTTRRVPVLSRAYKEVAEMYGEKVAEKIFFKNPESVIANLEMI